MVQEDFPNEKSPCDSERSAESETLLDTSLIEEGNSKRSQYFRSKMEAIHRRIDDINENIKHEVDALHREEVTISDENIDSLQNTCDMDDTGSEGSSEKSLYYSASNYSVYSLTSMSVDSAYNSFTRFVNSFVKTQGSKERASLLRLHSRNQISLNMMRHSLADLDSRCSNELQNVRRNLEHLKRLAKGCGVDLPSVCDPGVPEFHGVPMMRHEIRSELSLIWPPSKPDNESQSAA